MKQRYRVTEKIDMGGMAEIYRGRATSMEGIEKAVAIKRVLPQLTRNRKFVAMFLDEARLAMDLNHANIVQTFDVGRADNTYFIVMEYVDGYNLRKVFQRACQRDEALPVEIAAYILIEVCKGLAHAHEKRDENDELLHIIHRDVSPPNVLISKAGEVKLTDFGLAKAVSQIENTDPGVVKGKFSYLAPETAGGCELDHRADIFAVGIILFELLTMRRLFLGKTDAETVELVERAEIPRVSKLNPEIPRELEAILEQALEKDPRKRFPSANALANRLAEWLFAESLKVTSYDLAQFIKGLFGEKPKEDPQDRIDALIAEEVLNLSMLGFGPEYFGSDGSRPLKPGDLPASIAMSGRLPLSEIWAEPSESESDGEANGQEASAQAQASFGAPAGHDPVGTSASPSSPRVVIVALLLLGAVGTVTCLVYYLWSNA